MQLLQAKGIKDFVSIVVFTPDGGRLAAGSGDGCVRVWDLAAGKIAYTIDRRPTADHRAVVLPPDGRYFFTGDGPGIRVWDAATGAAVRTIPVDRGSPATVTITPNGRELLAADDPYSPGLRRWDAATGEALPTWPLPSPIMFARMAFSPDGRWLGAHAGAGVTVWDVATRAEAFAAPDAPDAWHRRPDLVAGRPAARVRVRKRFDRLGHRRAPRGSPAQTIAEALPVGRVQPGWIDPRHSVERSHRQNVGHCELEGAVGVCVEDRQPEVGRVRPRRIAPGGRRRKRPGDCVGRVTGTMVL